MQTNKRNIIVMTAGESLWGFQSSLVFPETVLTVLLAIFGAGEMMIGSIGAISSGAIVLPQIVGLYLFRSRRKRKRQLILWHIIIMAPILYLMGGGRPYVRPTVTCCSQVDAVGAVCRPCTQHGDHSGGLA